MKIESFGGYSSLTGFDISVFFFRILHLSQSISEPFRSFHEVNKVEFVEITFHNF